jgi:hypothetical protein
MKTEWDRRRGLCRRPLPAALVLYALSRPTWFNEELAVEFLNAEWQGRPDALNHPNGPRRPLAATSVVAADLIQRPYVRVVSRIDLAKLESFTRNSWTSKINA